MNQMNWRKDSVALEVNERKYFTVSQARRSLVLLQRIVGEVIKEYGHLLELEELIEVAGRGGGDARLEKFRRRLVVSVDNLQGCLEELELVGVELKDFTRGIVDFPARHEGREIRLCWMFGERDIRYWHEIDAGFAGRRPVAELLLQEEAIEI